MYKKSVAVSMLAVAMLFAGTLCAELTDITRPMVHRDWFSFVDRDSGISRTGTSTTNDSSVAGVGLDFLPEYNCRAMFTVNIKGVPLNRGLLEHPLLVDMNSQLRVDTVAPWLVSDALVWQHYSLDGTTLLSTYGFTVPPEFVVEIADGRYLRIKLGDDVSAFRVSLNGSRSAINQAYANCSDVTDAMPDDDDYFEGTGQPVDDEAYF